MKKPRKNRLRLVGGGGAIAGALLVGVFWCCAWGRGAVDEATAGAANPNGLRGVTMPSLIEVHLALRDTSFLVGGSLAVDVAVRNVSNAIVEVRDPEDGSPFEYEISEPDSGRVLRTVSYERHLRETQKMGVVPRAVKSKNSNPNEQVTYADDLAKYFVEPLPVGDYDVTAVYPKRVGSAMSIPAHAVVLKPDTTRSAPLRIHVVAQKPAAIAHAIGGNLELRTVIANLDGAGSPVLYDRSSLQSNPQAGAFHARARGAAGEAVQGVVVATGVEFIGAGYWTAWLKAGRLGASLSDGATQLFALPPVSLGMASPQIVPAAWQFNDGLVLFLATGIRDGRAKVQVIPVLKRAVQPSLIVDLGTETPSKAVAAYRLGAAGRQIELVWTTTSANGQTRLLQRTIDLDKSAGSSGNQVLAECSGRLQAMAMCPLLVGQDDFVDVLVGPESSQFGARTMTYMRVPVGGGKGGQRFTFQVPGRLQTGEADSPADAALLDGQWAISINPHPLAPVLAKVANRLFKLNAAISTEWVPLGKDVSRARQFGVFHLAPPQGLQAAPPWLYWIDEARGLIMQPM